MNCANTVESVNDFEGPDGGVGGYQVNKIYACNSVPNGGRTAVDFLCLNDNTIYSSSGGGDPDKSHSSSSSSSSPSPSVVSPDQSKHHQSFYPEIKSIPSPTCAANLPLNIYGGGALSCPPPIPQHPNLSPSPFAAPMENIHTYSNSDPSMRSSPELLELSVKNNSSKYITNNNNNINVHNNNTRNNNCSRNNDHSVANIKLKKKLNRAEPTFLEIQPDGPVVRDEDMVVPGRVRIEKMLHRILHIAAIAETFSKNPASIFR